MGGFIEKSICNNALRPIYGPSSSHTFAPAQIAYFAHRCFGELDEEAEVKVYFIGETGITPSIFQGHMSDRAVITALLGVSPYGEEFGDKMRNLPIKIEGDTVYVENIGFQFFIGESSLQNYLKNSSFAIKININTGDKEIQVLGSLL